MFDYAGSFGGDKDAAAKVRDELLKPALKEATADVIVDFVDVEFVTQSFIHALLSAVVRKEPSALNRLRFDNCSESVREIIEIVVQYSQ
jgi:anti-anti-sigma regulatory factor